MSEEIERVLGTGAQHLSEMQVGKAMVKAQSVNAENASVVIPEVATDVPSSLPVIPVDGVPASNTEA